MSFEGIDEWDENFLDEAIRIELEALSSRNLPSDAPEPTILRPSSYADLNSSSRPHRDAIEPPYGRVQLHSERETDSFAPIPSFGLGARGLAFDVRGGGLSFSPPRELSQRHVEKPNSEMDCEILEPWVSRGERFSGGGITERDREVERLKRELGRVSKHLKHLERECTELKKEKTKKDEQLKLVFSEIEAKEAEIYNLKSGKLDHRKSDFQNAPNAGTFIDQACHHPVNEDNCTWHTSQALDGTSDFVYSKTKGENGPSSSLSLEPRMFECNEHKVEHVQTTGLAEYHGLVDNSSITCTGVNIQKSFFPKKAAQSKGCRTVGTQTEICQDWGHSSLEDLTEYHISSKLLNIWDFPNSLMTGKIMISRLLVSCTADFCVLFRCMSMTSHTDLDCHADKNFSHHMTLHDDAQSELSVDASKVSRLYAILTKMHNGVSQLHDLLEALLELCTLENCTLLRNNILVGQPLNDNMHRGLRHQDWYQNMDIHHKRTYGENENSGLPMADISSFDLENLCTDKVGSDCDIKFLSSESLVSIFKCMQLVAMKNMKEDVRIEALGVMILIMMESNPSTERDKFGLMSLLEVLPKLLQKEAGPHVQKHALHLLFLLLNCPKMLLLFSNGGKENDEHAETVDHSVALEDAVNLILEGLSKCLSPAGTGDLELKLHKQAIILLAYVASCGKSGFEILLKSVGPRGVNFLQIIIQVLASELDVEIAGCALARTLCKERTSLFREALILLNRLASHPIYSKATMEALTSSNPIASLTVDVVSRLPLRSKSLFKYDDAMKSQMEAETTDLAQLFRTRVFAFVGGKHIS
ncbi:unnamed protein product [Musa acuminata subsp. burmannicoides]